MKDTIICAFVAVFTAPFAGLLAASALQGVVKLLERK